MLSIEYDPQGGVLQPPQLNIPAKGFVPDTVETFSVHLPCSGNVSGEVPISINLFVQAPPRRNDTRLNFKRNKICLQGKREVRVWEKGTIAAVHPATHLVMLIVASF